MSTQLQSEVMKEIIAQNRQRQAQTHAEISVLQREIEKNRPGRGGRLDVRGHPAKIAELHQRLANLEAGIVRQQIKLPIVEAAEAAVIATAAKDAQAEATAAARAVAERDQNMKSAARQRYLASGGDPAQFESLWPSIQQQIATANATAAAAAALTAPTAGDLVSRAASDYLDSRYKRIPGGS